MRTARRYSFVLLGCLGVVFVLAAQVWGVPDKNGDAPGATYIGQAKCKMCHLKSHRTWNKMKHAKAWVVLQAEHRKPTATDADGRACVSCHVTGYGEAQRGGFVDAEKSSHLLGVQCEACHGPGSKHHDEAQKLRKAQKKFEPNEPRFIIRKTTKCADCHNVHVSHAKFAAKKGG